jgi:hypothetical protein
MGRHFPETGGMLVVGRATNGTFNSFPPIDLTSMEKRRGIIQEARTKAESYQLQWLNSPYERSKATTASRSAFWRLARATLDLGMTADSLREEGDNWWDRIAWTTIAKLAASALGNPPNWLSIAQSAAAWELVRMEVRELNPSVILLVAGGWVP